MKNKGVCYAFLIIILLGIVIPIESSLQYFNLIKQREIPLSHIEQNNTLFREIPILSNGGMENVEGIHIYNNWTETNSTYEWCSGSGTKEDPYLIQNIIVNKSKGTMNAGINIIDTIEYFVFKNVWIIYPVYQRGMYLWNVSNGFFLDMVIEFDTGYTAVEGNLLNNITYNNITIYGGVSYTSGFRLNRGNDMLFLNNKFYTCQNGITLISQSDIEGTNNITIKDNYFFNSSLRDIEGYVSGDEDNLPFTNIYISNNRFEKGLTAIEFRKVDNLSIQYNSFDDYLVAEEEDGEVVELTLITNLILSSNSFDCKDKGLLSLYECNNSEIRYNRFIGGGKGIMINGGNNHLFDSNRLNIERRVQIDEDIIRTYSVGLLILSCFESIVRNNTFTEMNTPLVIVTSNDIIIERNHFLNLFFISPQGNFETLLINRGILILVSENITILDNLLKGEYQLILIEIGAVYHDIVGYSKGILVSHNKLNKGSIAINILYLEDSLITSNIIEDNLIGIKIENTGRKIQIYYNRFLKNKVQAMDNGYHNIWDDGKARGNYWDDYEGYDNDGDGIGDTPYLIIGTANAEDRYPIWDIAEEIALDIVPLVILISVLILIGGVVSFLWKVRLSKRTEKKPLSFREKGKKPQSKKRPSPKQRTSQRKKSPK